MNILNTFMKLKILQTTLFLHERGFYNFINLIIF